MENAKKSFIAGYIVTIFTIGILSYLSSSNSASIVLGIVSVLVVSGLFFYGTSFLKD